MSKHTPGPWRILSEECDRPYIRIRGSKPGTRYKVANVMTPAWEGVDPREVDETRANARLIASAPDMLSILQDLYDSARYWSEYEVPIGIVERIKKVLEAVNGQ